MVASGFRSTLLAPLIALQTQAELLKTSQTRFTAVEAERDSLVLLADSLPAVRLENEQLRQVLNLRGRLAVGHVSAEVLHEASPLKEFGVILSAGRAQG